MMEFGIIIYQNQDIIKLKNDINWLDAGSPKRILDISNYIYHLEKEKKSFFAYLENIALKKGFISEEQYYQEIDRNKKMVETFEQVMEIWWGEAPYNIKGEFNTVTTQETLTPEIGQGIAPKPLTQPHPPVVVTALTPHSHGITLAAERGWKPISCQYVQSHWVATHLPKYLEGLKNAKKNEKKELSIEDKLKETENKLLRTLAELGNQRRRLLMTNSVGFIPLKRWVALTVSGCGGLMAVRGGYGHPGTPILFVSVPQQVVGCTFLRFRESVFGATIL